MHYPPFVAKLDDSGFTKLLEEYKVDKVIFGHIHGNKYGYMSKTIKNDIEYYLTSCDLVDNKLIEIL